MREKPQWLSDLFPWPQQALVVNGRHDGVRRRGRARRAAGAAAPGNPTWGFLYRDFIEPLTAAGYRVIVPDWIGAGYSDHPRVDAALTLAHHIADLVSLIDQLDLRGFVIVGAGLGRPAGSGRGARSASTSCARWC